MNDDDLTRALAAWAAATDPATDPITADEVAAASDDGATVREPARLTGTRRGLAMAAAVVALAGVAAAVALAVTRPDDRAPAVATSGADDVDPTAPRTQVVVIADLDDGDAPQTHRFAIEPQCPDRAACIPQGPLTAGPLRPGTSLVAHLPWPAGEWSFRYEADTCGDPCGPLDETGALVGGGDHPLGCTVDVPGGPGRVVVRVTDPADDVPTCALEPPGTVPGLTVPPAWSVRAPLPWSCGTGAWDVGRAEGPSDREAADAALACFAESVRTGAPVELPTGLGTKGPVPAPRQAWWRTGTALGPDRRPIEILLEQGGRGQPWAQAWCRTIRTGAVQSVGRDDTAPAVPPDTTASFGFGEEVLVDDCTEAEPLPLDLPPLDEPAPPTSLPTATTAPSATAPPVDTTSAGPGTVDVVVDADDLPLWVEGVERRWVLSVSGGEVLGEGLVEEAGSPPELAGDPAVSLVARGVPVPAGKALLLTLDEHDCFGGGCSPPRSLPGQSAPEGVAPASTCASEVPPADQARVIVLTLRAGTCRAALAGAVPDLTVPPGWTLRTTDVQCTIPLDGTAEDAGRCLGDAQTSDRTAEWWTSDEDGRPLVWRVNAVQDVDLVHPGTAGGPWTIEHCSGLGLLDVVPGPEIDGCLPEEEMPLTP